MTARTRIVVPVFNAVSQTQRCLQALSLTLQRNQADADVMVIDDASDSPAMPALLEWAKQNQPHWTVIRKEINGGFVQTVNEGMQRASRQDVILLNSDTVPAGHWLDRMIACAIQCPDAASITPFTNNGEIASLPEHRAVTPVPDDPEHWAAACESVEPPQYPELPTAVGFCMYLRRACLDRIGLFDAETFGRGYGEENDWCMRARQAGWTHRLCDDAFVAHEGNASFGPLGLRPDEHSMQRLLARHPDYSAVIADFIQRDPIAPIRTAIMSQINEATT